MPNLREFCDLSSIFRDHFCAKSGWTRIACFALWRNRVPKSGVPYGELTMANEKKTVTINVNTERKEVDHGKLTFQQIVRLAYPTETDYPLLLFKLTYRRGQGHSNLMTLGEGANV